MKLLRYGPDGQEKPGMLDASGTIRDLSGVIPDLAGEALSAAGLAKLRGAGPGPLPEVPATRGSGRRSTGMKNFVCIGLNYADHAAETGAPMPKEPIVFLKSLGALCGPNDDVIIPKGSREDRLGSRARASSSAARRKCVVGRRGDGPCRRLLPSATTSPSANGRSSAAAPGTRARAATPSARSAPGW